MAHGAGPGAAHFRGRAPAALDDDQRVEQFLRPIGAPPRLAPGERCQRGDHRPHMVLLHHRIAVGGLDTPQAEQEHAVDADIFFDARQQRGVLLGLFPALGQAPIGDAAVEILPDLFLELRLVADLLEHAGVRLQPCHHPRIGGVRNAARTRARTKGLHPLRKRDCSLRLRLEGIGQRAAKQREENPARDARSVAFDHGATPAVGYRAAL